MTAQGCPREDDVVARVLSNTLEADEPLQRHASQCEVCRDAAAVAALLHEEERLARRDVQVPAAGQVWWRAAIRARAEAVHAAERPLAWLHGVAGAIAAGLVAGAITFAWPSISRGLGWLAAADPFLAVRSSLPIAMTVAACLILAPIAIYLVLSDE